MSTVDRSVPILLSQTGTYLWGDRRIRKLPINVANLPHASQQRFIQSLRNLPNSSFRILNREEREALFEKKWDIIQKNIPKDYYLEKIFVIVTVAGAVFFLALNALEFKSRL